MEKIVRLEGRGPIPCPHHPGEAHAYQGPPLSAAELIGLLGRATARQARLGIAIDNLRRILMEEGLLPEDQAGVPEALLEDVRQALDLAQSTIPGVHREALARVTRALERLESYQDHLPRRGQA